MSRLESEPRRFVLNVDKNLNPSKSKENFSIDSRPALRETVYPVEQLERAVEAFDEKPSVGILLQNARVLMSGREYELASHLLIEVLKRDPGNPLSIRSLGDCYYQMKNWEKAERLLKVSSEISPTVEVLLQYAEVLYLKGDNEESLHVYNEILLDIADDVGLLFKVYKFMGNIFIRLGDLDSAEESYNKAYSLNPASDVLLVNYATLEIQRGLIQQALERYRQALEINDQNEKAWIGLAMIHREYGDFELAWGNLHKALDLDKTNQAALQMIADWAVKDHRYGDAIERLQDYLSINDQDAEKSFLLAKLFYIAGRKNMAELEATRALNFNAELPGGEEFLQILRQGKSQ